MPGSSRRPTADAEGLLPYKIDSDPLKTPVTSFAGLPLVAETFRALGLDREADRLLTIKKRQRGYTEGQLVESFALLLAAGGECLDDFGKLRDEQGLPALLGYLPPSPDAARRFLYAFHDEATMARRPLGQLAWVPPESASLIGLGQLNHELIHRYVRQLPKKEVTTATLDHDATIIESKKQEALHHYLGDGATSRASWCGRKPIWWWPMSLGTETSLPEPSTFA